MQALRGVDQVTPGLTLADTRAFGRLLRETRERRDIPLSDIARKTKISMTTLGLLESGALEDLPAEVFVRGFIRSYAMAVDLPAEEPLGLFDQALALRRRAKEELAATPVSRPLEEGPVGEQDGLAPKREIGLAVFVIIMLLIATITLSLFLRQPPQTGEQLSQVITPATTKIDPVA
jgi:cytoskeletal protein RodZ